MGQLLAELAEIDVVFESIKLAAVVENSFKTHTETN